MKKIIFFIVIMAGLVLMSGIAYAQSLEFNQVRQAVSYPNCSGRGIATHASSRDVVITGYFGGLAIFETEKLDTAGANDVFIARYDDTGSLLWVKQAGGANTDEAYGIATDASGNSIVVGRFLGTIFGETTFPLTSAKNDMFVAKYDPEGNLLWAEQAGGIEDYEAYGYSVATDNSDNIYVTGRFLGTIFSGAHQITSTGFWDVFIAKYNSNGDMQWSKKAGGSAEDQGNGIAIDASGNVVITGRFYGNATFGPDETNVTPLTGAGFNDLFVAKFDSSNGNLIWAKSAGGTKDDIGYGVTTDASGSIFVTGEFSETATFATTDLVSSGGKDVFIAKYTASGDMAFAEKAGGTENDIGRGIATEATTGDIVVTGEFSGTATFDGTPLESAGQTDVFVARYSASGDLVSAFKAGGIENDAGQGVVAPGQNSIICVGEFKGVAPFGNISMASAAENSDLFVAFIGEAALPPGVPGDWSGNGQVGLEDAIGILQFMSKMRE